MTVYMPHATSQTILEGTTTRVTGCSIYPLLKVHNSNTNPRFIDISPYRRSSHGFRTYTIDVTPTVRWGPSCPCQNGGTCITPCSDNMYCSCPSSYTGDLCQFRQGRLTINVLQGNNLQDRDDYTTDTSDPYLKITAYDANGDSQQKKTDTKWNTLNPIWNQNIDFGVYTWRRFSVRVWDNDRSLFTFINPPTTTLRPLLSYRPPLSGHSPLSDPFFPPQPDLTLHLNTDDALSDTTTWNLPSDSPASFRINLQAYQGYVTLV